jgi:hypothetical protein
MTDDIITIRDYSNEPRRPLYEQSRFWVDGREFNQQAGSLIWFSADGWRFWLGEEVRAGVWTMGADRGQSEQVFAFGVFEGPAEALAELERMVAI